MQDTDLPRRYVGFLLGDDGAGGHGDSSLLPGRLCVVGSWRRSRRRLHRSKPKPPYLHIETSQDFIEMLPFFARRSENTGKGGSAAIGGGRTTPFGSAVEEGCDVVIKVHGCLLVPRYGRHGFNLLEALRKQRYIYPRYTVV